MTADSDAIPTRVCTNVNVQGQGIVCAKRYERFRKHCPYCGHYPEPPARSAPEFVDGDLFELDAATLAAMRGKVIDFTAPLVAPGNLPAYAQTAVRQKLMDRNTAQFYLREAIALWAGWMTHLGHTDSEGYRRFYHAFGVDVLSAQALGRPEAETLTERIRAVLQSNMVTPA